MITRREVVTAGVLGTIGAGTPAAAEAAEMQQDMGQVNSRLNEVKTELEELNRSVTEIRRVYTNSISSGNVGGVRGEIEKYLKTTGKFPDYIEVGTTVFHDLYDWHVRMQQQIQVTQLANQRMMIKFMFTQCLLRWELGMNYIGAPYDR